jgi:tetratricopeptide (TPR) repeat protein
VFIHLDGFDSWHVGAFKTAAPLMSKASSCRVSLLVATLLFSAPSFAQSSAKKEAATQDFSKEGAVIEQMTTRVVFQSDGTSVREQRARVRMLSDAGVRQYGVIPLPYQASVERVEVQDVHVTNRDGSVVATPLDSIQDVTSEIYREAPMYSDLREKHVAVKGLEPGNTLDYSVRWEVEKPLATGQFWFSYQFIKSAVVLDEQLEISVPREREVKLKNQTVQPTTHEEAGRRIYTWKASNLESESVEKQKDALGYDAYRGWLPAPDVLISSFRSWDEVGRWYDSLQQEKIQPSPEVRAKAEELTKGLSDDDAKIQAIYNYVSLRYRYVAIDIGIGRYQPHAAGEILGNQYGDCKDKHTLLAALLSSVGIHAYPALINSQMTVDADVPSPGQFNHVISVVTKGSTLSWMDTTPELTPMGDLVFPLRRKPALVILPDKVSFQNTPANPQLANKDNYKITAKLDADGTLEAHQEWKQSGDSELYFRYAFRRVPESQWKDLLQRNSYAAQLGAIISDVHASAPERTGEPFAVTYDYSLKDFSSGDKHRFVLPIPLRIPTVKDEDLKRTTPLWLGYTGETQFESRIQLPKGWIPTQLPPLDLKETFAEFEGSSEVDEGVLISRRRLVLKASAVTPDQLTKYKAFEKAISDYYNSYTFLRVPSDLGASGPTSAQAQTAARVEEQIRQGQTPQPASGTSRRAQGATRAAELLRDSMTQLPTSPNVEACQAELNARKSMQKKDSASAITALKYAVSLDATFSRAWIELGWMYAGSTDKNSALDAFQKAAEAEPKQVIPYKILAFMYADLGKRDEAVATWQKVQSIAPDDPDAPTNLGWLYLAKKLYPEAVLAFESAARANPSDAFAQMRLGVARLRSHDLDDGMNAMHKALEIDSGAEMLNDVAYEMAEADTNFPEALTYSQRSVKEIEERSQKLDFEKIQKADRQLPMSVTSYWDTLGWIYFKMGDLAKAEVYLNSAWELGQYAVVGDHLGQVYEKEKKLPAAVHMYNLALEVNPRLEDTPARMRNLAHVSLPKNRMSAREELNMMRTLPLPAIVKDGASADFDVLLVAGKIENVNFVSGSDSLRNAGESLKQTTFEEAVPPSSTVHLLRRGAVSCTSYTGCSFVFYPLSVAARAN